MRRCYAGGMPRSGFRAWWDRYRHFRAAQGVVSDILDLIGLKKAVVAFVIAIGTFFKARLSNLVPVEQFTLALVAFAVVLWILNIGERWTRGTKVFSMFGGKPKPIL